jgi:DNA-binding NtrC family response regulator/pSer/pThr/pTyr-binding forkhead associated (FHA) protein
MPARLIVETGVASPPVLDFLEGEDICIGRSRECKLFLDDNHASRLHARIHHDGQAWHVTDLKTTNGTRVNGARVDESKLLDGYLIGIGTGAIRFRLLDTGEITPVESLERQEGLLAEGSAPIDADDLSALLRFTRAAHEETLPQGLISRALKKVVKQTGASLAGFLSLDPETPELRLAFPAQAEPDPSLSRKLTQAALKKGGPVWLGSSQEDPMDSESLSRFHDAVCVPLRSHGGAEPLGALHAYKNHAFFNERQVRFCELLGAHLAAALQSLRTRQALVADNKRLRVKASEDGEVIGSSAVMARVRDQVRRLAAATCTVLIVGETGVGKELAALGLHHQSRRHAGPMVTVNCASIAGTLAEAELFGVAGRAYTGGPSTARPGYFSQADMGTLFLDEVGELSLDIQAKLLRAIESKSFRPVGGTSDSRSDVRVIAATNRDLRQEVRDGTFRQDLYFRLTASITIPPLREHKEDIPELSNYFLEALSREYGRSFSLTPRSLEKLMAYHWPGNIRQLRSVLEAAVAGGARNVIDVGDLALMEDHPCQGDELLGSLNLKELEDWAVRQAWKRAGENVTRAAQLLGIHRSTLHEKLKGLGLRREDPT